jgi:hypothetical protein
VYKEGFADKYAKNISKEEFSDLNDLCRTFLDFMKLCNVKQQSIHIQWSLL